jgi:PIN domain nuclease of toxin-antitoxin system
VNYLLDTQVLVWLGNDSAKLGKSARRTLKRASKLFFSPISIAELEVKSSKGKFKVSHNFVENLTDAGLTELPFTSLHAQSVSRFPVLLKHDPADRMILAQAATEQLPLITSDQTLLDLKLNWIIDAHD